MTNDLKLKLRRQHFLFEALLINQQPKYSASKGTCVGTAAILDFLFSKVPNIMYHNATYNICMILVNQLILVETAFILEK